MYLLFSFLCVLCPLLSFTKTTRLSSTLKMNDISRLLPSNQIQQSWLNGVGKPWSYGDLFELSASDNGSRKKVDPQTYLIEDNTRDPRQSSFILFRGPQLCCAACFVSSKRPTTERQTELHNTHMIHPLRKLLYLIREPKYLLA